MRRRRGQRGEDGLWEPHLYTVLHTIHSTFLRSPVYERISRSLVCRSRSRVGLCHSLSYILFVMKICSPLLSFRATRIWKPFLSIRPPKRRLEASTLFLTYLRTHWGLKLLTTRQYYKSSLKVRLQKGQYIKRSSVHPYHEWIWPTTCDWWWR